MKKLKLGLMAVLWCLGAAWPVGASAEGRIAGVVIDGLTGQPLRGVTLTVAGAGLELRSDVGGSFAGELPAGSYSIEVSKEGFEAQTLTGITVVEDGVADFAVVLLPASDVGARAAAADGNQADTTAAFSGEISVTAEVEKATEAALLAERRASSDISDLIGAQEISKNSGSDAAAVLQRVTGVSVQQEKYVFVRGLGERYSNTSLNGSRLPTTEFDKKVVPLDLFPAKLLDTVRVSKSYAADQPGDFAAGLVELSTLDFPPAASLELSLGMTSNSATTGEAFGEYAGGLSWDGKGGQPLPSSIPDERLSRANPFLPGAGFSSEELQAFGRDFLGAWTATGAEHGYAGSNFSSAPTTPNLSLTYGTTYGALGMVLSATHSHGYDHENSTRRIYTLGAGGDLRLQNDYDFTTDEEKVRRGLVGNFAFRVNDRNTIELRTLYTDDSKAESRYFEGYNDDQSTDVRDYRVGYQREEIGSYQLSGEHFLEQLGDGTLVEWRGSLGSATNQQNLRESLYKYENNHFVLTDESQSAFLLYNDLEDDIVDGGVDFTQFFSGDAMYGNLQTGVAFANRERSFSSRRFRYNFRNLAGMDLSLMPDEILVADNINPYGFEIKEETRPTDAYDASHEVAAVYAMADLSFGRWRFVGGLRYEDSVIDVTTFDPFNLAADPIVSTLDDQDFMPSLSMVYRMGDHSNLRAAFSQTVNRPEFRELARFEFTDVVGGRSARGNPDLQSASIRSFDLRYEWFPDSFGVVAASLFYKDFSQPIERTLLLAVELQSTWQNVESAENMGLELEFRRDLGFISQSLAPFSVQLNYTYVDSQVKVGDDNQIVTNTERALVGQPDHVVNAVVEWQQASWGSTTRLLYTYTGEKIFEAGGLGIPDVVEQPWTSLDFVWRQDLSFLAQGLGAKLSLTNILDDNVEFLGGWDETYTRGRGLSLSLSYSAF